MPRHQRLQGGALALAAEPLERGGIHPHAIATGAIADIERSDPHDRHAVAAAWTELARGPGRQAGRRRAAPRAERGARKDRSEA